jgi:methylated-DNA-protein-cysteine methyltransferase related protein
MVAGAPPEPGSASVMPSLNYERICRQVYDVVERIPRGRITTSGCIGDELAVPARHVAYVLSRLPDDTNLPWRRAVASDGALS